MEDSRKVMWVRGHTAAGVAGNEAVDRKANLAAYGGRVGLLPDQVTLAGIRQEYLTHHKPKHLEWDRKSVKGLTYMVTDCDPLRKWLKTIARREDDR